MHRQLNAARAVFSEDVIVKTKGLPSEISDPYLSDDAYDELGECVVEYFRRYGTQPREPSAALWR